MWVIDTSSLIELKQLPNVVKSAVLKALDALVDSDRLLFPAEVVAELERRADMPYTWAKKNESVAKCMADLTPRVREVLARVPDLIDPLRVSDIDEADPYVIAYALHRRANGDEVTVITNDYATIPSKTSLSDAAGVHGLASVTLRAFLVSEGIWDGKTGL